MNDNKLMNDFKELIEKKNGEKEFFKMYDIRKKEVRNAVKETKWESYKPIIKKHKQLEKLYTTKTKQDIEKLIRAYQLYIVWYLILYSTFHNQFMSMNSFLETFLVPLLERLAIALNATKPFTLHSLGTPFHDFFNEQLLPYFAKDIPDVMNKIAERFELKHYEKDPFGNGLNMKKIVSRIITDAKKNEEKKKENRRKRVAEAMEKANLSSCKKPRTDNFHRIDLGDVNMYAPGLFHIHNMYKYFTPPVVKKKKSYSTIKYGNKSNDKTIKNPKSNTLKNQNALSFTVSDSLSSSSSKKITKERRAAFLKELSKKDALKNRIIVKNTVGMTIHNKLENHIIVCPTPSPTRRNARIRLSESSRKRLLSKCPLF